MFNKLLIFILFFSYCYLAQAEIQLSGEVIQGGFIVGKTLPNSKVTLDNNPLTTSNDGYFTFGFSRDDTTTHKLVIHHASGSIEHKKLTPKIRQYNIQRVTGIAKKIMNPDPVAIKRATEDRKHVKRARSLKTNRTDFISGFSAPIKGQITGVYGSQRFYNGKPKSPHYGLDYAGKTGDPVRAPADGVVTLFEPDMFYSGGTMIIDHGHGITSSFLHLSRSYVAVGDEVKQGQTVAAVGSSGRATGPHLDWRVNWFQVRLDPALVLKTKPIK